MNNRGLSSNTKLLKKPKQMPVDYSQSTTCGSCLYCITPALAGEGSSKHLCLKCQQLGLVSPSPTNSLKSCQLRLVGSMPYSSWKMQYPMEIVLHPRGLLRKSTFAITRPKSGMLLLPHNKILLSLLALFLTLSPSLLHFILERNAWYGYSLAVKYMIHIFFSLSVCDNWRHFGLQMQKWILAAKLAT